MNKNIEVIDYRSPQVEILEIEVEKGFAGTNGQDMTFREEGWV